MPLLLPACFVKNDRVCVDLKCINVHLNCIGIFESVLDDTLREAIVTVQGKGN